MIKKFLFAAVCICSLSFVSQAQQALKFGTVNSQEIFMLMPEKATAEQTLQDINKKYEDEFVKIQEEFTKKYKEYMALGDRFPRRYVLVVCRRFKIPNLVSRVSGKWRLRIFKNNKKLFSLLFNRS